VIFVYINYSRVFETFKTFLIINIFIRIYIFIYFTYYLYIYILLYILYIIYLYIIYIFILYILYILVIYLFYAINCLLSKNMYNFFFGICMLFLLFKSLHSSYLLFSLYHYRCFPCNTEEFSQLYRYTIT